MRREFMLPEIDVEFLESLKLDWETISSGGNWLLIHKVPVPEGYNLAEVTTALMIAPGYPVSQIDMAYFYPHLTRNDGKGIGALASHVIDNKNFQRWSRHRTAENPWRPGLDDVSTHLQLVHYWFERELNK